MQSDILSFDPNCFKSSLFQCVVKTYVRNCFVKDNFIYPFWNMIWGSWKTKENTSLNFSTFIWCIGTLKPGGRSEHDVGIKTRKNFTTNKQFVSLLQPINSTCQPFFLTLLHHLQKKLDFSVRNRLNVVHSPCRYLELVFKTQWKTWNSIILMPLQLERGPINTICTVFYVRVFNVEILS